MAALEFLQKESKQRRELKFIGDGRIKAEAIYFKQWPLWERRRYKKRSQEFLRPIMSDGGKAASRETVEGRIKEALARILKEYEWATANIPEIETPDLETLISALEMHAILAYFGENVKPTSIHGVHAWIRSLPDGTTGGVRNALVVDWEAAVWRLGERFGEDVRGYIYGNNVSALCEGKSPHTGEDIASQCRRALHRHKTEVICGRQARHSLRHCFGCRMGTSLHV